jgi:ABC-type multidrug transport system ATPase subunit
MLLAQIRALVRKDFQVIAVHRRRVVFELIYPLFTGVICCFLLVVVGKLMNGLSNFFQNAETQRMMSSNATGFASMCYGTLMAAPQSLATLLNDGGAYFPPPCNYTSYGYDQAQTFQGFTDASEIDSYWQVQNNGSQSASGIAFIGGQGLSVRYSPYSHSGDLASTMNTVQEIVTPFFARRLDSYTAVESSAQMFNWNMFQMTATGAALLLQTAFVPLATSTAGRLVDEKRTKVREHLKVMGVTSAAYLVSSLTTSLIRVLIATCSILIVLFAWGHQALPLGDIGLIGVLIFFYGMSVCAFGHILPAFVSRPQMSNAIVSLFVVALTVGGTFMSGLGAGAMIPFNVFFSPAASMCAIAQLTGRRGVTLPISPEATIALLIWHCVFYSLLAEYLYAVNPGDYGVPKHPLFPCYWLAEKLGLRQKEGAARVRVAGDEASHSHDDRIIMEGLTKYFGSQRDVAAVDRLSLRIRNKEIFALLGHNGAGKTTTISMLIGMISATEYTKCSIEGYDMDTQMDEIRRSISCCPQFDVLFDDLSGIQHMELYAAIKGVPATRAHELLERLHLPLNDQRSQTYSGGMKRRLSVGCALVGGSTVIFLDEPSSGLDPLSRRRLWSLLKDERDAGKTIVLTTHFMEEADYLGDRIAIMSHGALVCCDTSNNLKHTHGVGYYLTVVKDPDATGSFRSDALLSLCNKHCDNGAKLHSETNADAVFLLPTASLDQYGDLLQRLEDSLRTFGASSYGIAMNSLEDVFVSISERQEARRTEEKNRALGRTAVNADNDDTTVNDAGDSTSAIFAASVQESIVSLFFFHTLTIMYKKARVLFRSPRLIFFGVVVPCVFVVIGFASAIPQFSQNSFDDEWRQQSTNAFKPMPDLTESLPVLLYPIRLYAPGSGGGPSRHDAEIDPECVSAVLAEYQSVWTEYWHGLGAGIPPLKLQVVSDKSEIEQMRWINTHSVSWIAEASHPAILFINSCPPSSVANAKRGRALGLNYTWNYDTQDLSPRALLLYDFIFRSAMLNAAYKLAGDSPPPLSIVDFQPLPPLLPVASTTAPPSTPSPNQRHHSNFQQYIVIIVFIMLIVGSAQFAANAALQVADEFNKGTFDMLRMHGLSASAYWLGTFVFDMLTAGPAVVLTVAGPFIRGIHAMQDGCILTANLFALLGLLGFMLIMGYAVVVVLPRNLKHSTYVAAVYTANLLMMSLPFAIMGIMYAIKGNGLSESNVEWTYYFTPQRALMMIGGIQDDFTDGAECAWSMKESKHGFLSIFLWYSLPLLIIAYRTHGDILQRFNLPRRPTPVAIVNGPSGGIEREPLMAAHTLTYSSLPLDADVDVAREYDRVARLVQDCDSPYAPGLAAAVVTPVHQAASTDVEFKPSPTSPMSPATAAHPAMDMYLVKDLHKMFHGSLLPCFGGGDKVAVRTLSFGLKQGECFGLLGPNGAGKTTTVKMMLRELVQTCGEIHTPFAPYDAMHGVCTGVPASRGSMYRGSRLGVCPQHDALWDQLNADEHMSLYLRIRLGSQYKASDWTNYIKKALKKVQLSEGGDKPSEKFSGGMKRKLSVCLAMYTGAAAVFLDEPSTGMDPHARRALWKSIHEALEDHRCVLLTTHSMEEADAVCARIAIVTDGLMQCIGSSQHLKNRYGSGYSVVLTLKPSGDPSVPEEQRNLADAQRSTDLDHKMAQVFGDTCTMKEALGLQRRYAIKVLPSVAVAFKRLAEHKAAWELENYSVTQLTSLEQIFIEFAGSSPGENN